MEPKINPTCLLQIEAEKRNVGGTGPAPVAPRNPGKAVDDGVDKNGM